MTCDTDSSMEKAVRNAALEQAAMIVDPLPLDQHSDAYEAEIYIVRRKLAAAIRALKE
jgi:hypothetical protein